MQWFRSAFLSCALRTNDTNWNKCWNWFSPAVKFHIPILIPRHRVRQINHLQVLLCALKCSARNLNCHEIEFYCIRIGIGIGIGIISLDNVLVQCLVWELKYQLAEQFVIKNKNICVIGFVWPTRSDWNGCHKAHFQFQSSRQICGRIVVDAHKIPKLHFSTRNHFIISICRVQTRHECDATMEYGKKAQRMVSIQPN